MLYRGSVADLKSGRLSRRYGHLAVVMQYYPRFLSRDLIDEYVRSLAPSRELFGEFKRKARELRDHDSAFRLVSYEARFSLTPDGLVELERLSGLARHQDVFLICQCQANERCHADLCLVAARHHFQAPIPYLRMSYPEFEERLKSPS